MKKNIWDKSYLKTRKERLEILKENNYISNESYDFLLNNEVISETIANSLIENQIGIHSIPLGIATNFLIDGKEYVIPYATEEPSVIAASCNAAKLIKSNGGFKTSINERLMCGHISFYDVKDIRKAKEILEDMKDELLNIANLSQKDIVNLGGGAKDIEILIKEDFLIFYLYVDTLDAMGANTINTMLEALIPVILEKIEAKKLMGIISNYSIRSLVKVECKIDIEEDIARRIEKAIDFANIDIYRAVTNNKGIMNAIDAILLASGNDNRAISAAIYAYSMKNGKYESLSKWKYLEDEKLLYGSLEIPMPVATFGGSIKITESSKAFFDILKLENAKEFAKVIVSAGLAQNFAALKALVTVGIQKGHMKLHAKSLALYLGANEKQIEKIVKSINENDKITMQWVKDRLSEM